MFDRFKKKLAAEQKGAIAQKALDSKSDLKKAQTQEPPEKREKLVAEMKETKSAEKPVAKKLELSPKRPLSIHSQAYRILLRPVVTEKAAHLQAQGQYVFEVSRDANKREVAKAVQQAYGVTPTHINTINSSRRARRFGQHSGWTKATKKAIVTLKAGEKIELFESV